MPKTHRLILPVEILTRGFWLYVWDIESESGDKYLYVGRTGDSSSPRAVSPYQRMGQHLGFQKNQNALRKYLEKQGIVPEKCRSIKLFSHGPLFSEKIDMKSHKQPRDIVAALENSLAETLCKAGYSVLNRVNCRMKLDESLHEKIIFAFSKHFRLLRSVKSNNKTRSKRNVDSQR